MRLHTLDDREFMDDVGAAWQFEDTEAVSSRMRQDVGAPVDARPARLRIHLVVQRDSRFVRLVRIDRVQDAGDLRDLPAVQRSCRAKRRIGEVGHGCLDHRDGDAPAIE